MLAVALTTAVFVTNILGHWIEHRFHVSNQKTWSWLKDYAKRALLQLGMGLVWVISIYIPMRHAGQHWWLISWIALATTYLAYAYFFPSIIIT